MVTNQVLTTVDRDINGWGIIQQRTKDSYFNVNNIFQVVNNYRKEKNRSEINMTHYLSQEDIPVFFDSVREMDKVEPYIKGRGGRNPSPGWVHPSVMVDIILWACPEYKAPVYKWLYDNLINSRIEGADSFKEMNAMIKKRIDELEGTYNDYKIYMVVALKIKKACGLSQNQEWNTATIEQLERRNKIQTGIISGIVLTNNSVYHIVDKITEYYSVKVETVN